MNVKIHEIILWRELKVFKSFNIIFVKSMVGEWCEILIIHKQYKNEKIFMQKKKHRFP